MTNADTLLTRIRREKQEAASLKELFTDFFPPEFTPEDRQFRIWLQKYDLDTAVSAVERTAEWYNTHLQSIEEAELEGKVYTNKDGDEVISVEKNKLDIIKYCSATMRNMARANNE
ncbi:MAG: hypothetical protein ABR865_15325 [Terracidiphilus sp.]|jgi:hypothetical protein